MNPDFHDLLRALSDAGARFLVVGAYAVSFHSEPRATGDLDIWIDPAPDNAARVYEALASFGAPLGELSEWELCTPDRGLSDRRRAPPHEFEDAWPARTEASYGGVRFPIIGIDALMKNKQALARPKDLVDLDLLRKHRRA